MVIRDVAGFVNNARGLYLFTDQQFRDACAGHSQQEVLHELDRLGLLFKNDRDRCKSQHRVRIHGAHKKVRLYAIKRDMLDQD